MTAVKLEKIVGFVNKVYKTAGKWEKIVGFVNRVYKTAGKWAKIVGFVNRGSYLLPCLYRQITGPDNYLY